jgi:succinyldiaminopimelate transaminase
MRPVERDRADVFVPPPYPYDRLDAITAAAAAHEGGVVDLSVGTPCDDPTESVLSALAGSGSERGYPPSVGTEGLRRAAARWMGRRFGLDVPPSAIAACVGTKEFVASTPGYMRLRRPSRDTVLYPAVAYPTYEMGALLAGMRPVPVRAVPSGGLDLSSISPEDAARAAMLWVNSPSNPTGALDDLAAAAQWGRANDVPVFSDECYTEFTWSRPPDTILRHGTDGVVAVHSLSKRSNLAGLRVGFYAGDADITRYLREVRKHAGLMVPGPAQAAGAAALDDDEHVRVQRDRYDRRLRLMSETLSRWSGVDVPLPEGGFYLWFEVGESPADAWAFAERLAREGGAVVSPGDFYGVHDSGWVRVAVVQPESELRKVAERLGAA